MVVPADPECPNDEPRPGKGSYELEFDEDTLVFTEVRDPCGDRAFTLTFYGWHRIEGS